MKLTLITTAACVTSTGGDQGPGATYNANAKFFNVFTVPTTPIPDLRISHLSYDRDHCLADDPNTWLPINALLHAEEQAIIGALQMRLFACLPTEASEQPLNKTAPRLLRTVRG